MGASTIFETTIYFTMLKTSFYIFIIHYSQNIIPKVTMYDIHIKPEQSQAGSILSLINAIKPDKALFTLPHAILMLALLLFSNPLFAVKESTLSAAKMEKQRSLFSKAEKALKKKQYNEFSRLMLQLDAYPLYPYLKYKEYSSKLSKLSQTQVDSFLKTYADTPYADRLRVSWLLKKAKNKQWQAYLDSYEPQKSTKLQCHYLNALIQTGQSKLAMQKAPELWLVGNSQPNACDPVFTAFNKSGALDSKLILERISLAMDKGRTSLAGYLSKSLSKQDKRWVDEWIKIHRKPATVTQSKLLKKNHPLKSTIQIHAVKRLSRHKPEAAIKLWNKLNSSNKFTPAEQALVYRTIGLKYAYKHHPDAWKWLDKVDDKYSDLTVQEWRVRSAIRQHNWPAIAEAINRLPEEEQKSLRWKYWLANAAEHQGNKDTSTTGYIELSRTRSFYGFLSADKLDTAYEFEDVPLAIPEKQLKKMEQHPGLQRAKEFYSLGQNINMRREWYFTTRKQMNNDERIIAAKVAQKWGWHNRAILTIAHTDQRDDIELRFPVLFEDKVKKHSKKQNLQPAYTYAVIRRESAFATDARSSVGALGLMQIMPATGKVIAKKLKVKYRNKNQLLNPDLNVKFGTTYLNMMLNKFYKQPALASAAYNAGGHRVKKWLPVGDNMSAERWIETIPFKETREYVSSILAYTAIYEHRMGLPQTRLKKKMPKVPQKRTM